MIEFYFREILTNEHPTTEASGHSNKGHRMSLELYDEVQIEKGEQSNGYPDVQLTPEELLVAAATRAVLIVTVFQPAEKLEHLVETFRDPREASRRFEELKQQYGLM